MIKIAPKIQLIIVVVVSAYFSIQGAGISALYGGLTSLLNTWLINKHTKQQEQSTASVVASVGMMLGSVAMRMSIVAVLTLLALLTFKLEPGALIIGLVLGQIGFLMDRIN